MRISRLLSPENKKPIVISHRGEWHSAPENSIESVLSAINAGADIVEIDVQAAPDGTVFLMHDDTTDRMTNRIGSTSGLDLNAIKQLRLKKGQGGKDAALTDHNVPLLTEVLDAAREKVCLNVDTKFPKDLDMVANLIVAENMQDQVLIKMSVDPETPDQNILGSEWFQKLTFMPVMLKPRPGKMAQDGLNIVKMYGASMIEVSFTSLKELRQTHDMLAEIDVKIWCNTLDSVHPMDYYDSKGTEDPEGVWGELIKNGISAIQTDHTPVLSAFLERR